MAKRGRKIKLEIDPLVTNRLVLLLKGGNTRRVAAVTAGISETRFYDWMNRGLSLEPEEKQFREFREAVTRAEAEAEVFMVESVRKAAQGYEAVEHEIIKGPDGVARTVEKRKHVYKPEMAIEWLRRRRPDDWGDTKKLEHTGANGGPIQSIGVAVNAETLTEADRQLAEWREQMKASLSDG